MHRWLKQFKGQPDQAATILNALCCPWGLRKYLRGFLCPVWQGHFQTFLGKKSKTAWSVLLVIIFFKHNLDTMALWFVKNTSAFIPETQRKLQCFPVLRNGATQEEFPDFDLLKAFGLEETKWEIWTLNTSRNMLFSLNLLNFLLKFAIDIN